MYAYIKYKNLLYIYIFLFIRYSNAAIKKPIDVIYTQRLGFIYNAKGTYVFEAFEKQLMNAKLTKKLVALKLLSFPWIAIGYIDDISSKIVKKKNFFPRIAPKFKFISIRAVS